MRFSFSTFDYEILTKNKYYEVQAVELFKMSIFLVSRKSVFEEDW